MDTSWLHMQRQNVFYHAYILSLCANAWLLFQVNLQLHQTPIPLKTLKMSESSWEGTVRDLINTQDPSIEHLKNTKGKASATTQSVSPFLMSNLLDIIHSTAALIFALFELFCFRVTQSYERGGGRSGISHLKLLLSELFSKCNYYC